MKKFVILVVICICMFLVAVPALAADEAWEGDVYHIGDDVDVYVVEEDTWVIGPPIAAPEPPEQWVAPLPVPPAPPSGAPRPAEGKGPAIDPEPKPDCGVGPAIDPELKQEPMPPRDDYEPTQESLEDILGLDEIFRIPEEEYEIYVEREESHVDTPAIESEPKWAFGAGITRWGRLTPAEMRLALTSSRHGAVQLRVVKVGNKLYFLGLQPGSKLILVDTTSLEIIRVVDAERPILSIDKPAGGILAILVDENLVYQSSRVI